MADLTSLRVFIERLRARAGFIILGLLLFIAGWQTGRVMPPYYAAHPIVFKEVVANNTGDPQALAALQASPKTVAQVPTPTVAAATTEQPTSINAPGQFFASKNSSLYHHQDCAAVKQIKEANKIAFTSREEAEKAGFSPSQCTKEKLGI